MFLISPAWFHYYRPILISVTRVIVITSQEDLAGIFHVLLIYWGSDIQGSSHMGSVKNNRLGEGGNDIGLQEAVRSSPTFFMPPNKQNEEKQKEMDP